MSLTTGVEHSPTGTAWERTPWRADAAGGVGGAEALRGASDDPQGERGESTASADQQ